MKTRRRKPPVAKNLIKNAISAYVAGIEIHNKPNFNYRYEVVIILMINAWELILKAYIYKYHKKEKILYKDGTSKSIDDCLNIVVNKLGKKFLVQKENIELLCEYRNMVIHFYSRDLDIIIYALLRKNVIFFSNFFKDNFNIDLGDESNLILLPIGFKKTISPIDFMSNESILKNSSKEVKNFISKIIASSSKLNSKGIEDTVFIDFGINLTNVRNTKNADIVAGVNNTQGNPINFEVVKKANKFTVSNEENAQPVKIIRDKSQAQAILVHEELSEGIFEEINNLIDVNELLNTSNKKFILGEELYYRIYSERHHVSYNIDLFEALASIAYHQFYCPHLFWITKLPVESIARIIVSSFDNYKYPNVTLLIQIMILLRGEGLDILDSIFKRKYGHMTQAPSYYYTALELIKQRKHPDLILKALRITKNRELGIPFPFIKESSTVQNILDNKNKFTGTLSELCLSVFEGNKESRGLCRTIDTLIYGDLITNRADEICTEIRKVLPATPAT